MRDRLGEDLAHGALLLCPVWTAVWRGRIPWAGWQAVLSHGLLWHVCAQVQWMQPGDYGELYFGTECAMASHVLCVQGKLLLIDLFTLCCFCIFAAYLIELQFWWWIIFDVLIIKSLGLQESRAGQVVLCGGGLSRVPALCGCRRRGDSGWWWGGRREGMKILGLYDNNSITNWLLIVVSLSLSVSA